MTDKQRRKIIKRRLAGTERIRVGRAAVYVATGDFSLGFCAEYSDQYRRGAISAREYVVAFAKARIASSSPTFSWDGFDEDVLVERICAVSRVPSLGDGSYEERAKRIDSAVLIQEKQLRESMERFRKRMTIGNEIARRWRVAAKANPALEMRRSFTLAADARAQLRYPNSSATAAAIRKLIAPELVACAPRVQLDLPDLSAWAKVHFPAIPTPESVFGEDWFERHFPNNWIRLGASMVRSVIDVMVGDRINLAWTPGPDVIEALVRAESTVDRDRILLENRKGIEVHAISILQEVDHDQLRICADATLEAIRSASHGKFGAALSRLGTIETHLIKHGWGMKCGHVRDQFISLAPHGDVKLDSYVLGAVVRVTAESLVDYDPSNPGFDPSRHFNRHICCHEISGYENELVYLKGLMLVSGLIAQMASTIDEFGRKPEVEFVRAVAA